jgi:hypothetical protein
MHQIMHQILDIIMTKQDQFKEFYLVIKWKI